MILMKLESGQPLTFQLPSDAKYSTHGWILIDVPMSNFNAQQIAAYRITEITDPHLQAALQYINYTVLDTGSVAYVTTVADHTPEDIASGHMHHFPTLDSADDIKLFLDGYKYLSCLEIQFEYDAKFSNLSVTTSSLEASTFAGQLEEAKAYMANPFYPTPMLSVISASSGISIADLANQVIAKQASYQQMQANLLGQMLGDKQAVMNCATPLEVKNLGWI